MKKVYAFIADGTEEIEIVAVVDILRRAGADVKLTSVNGATVTLAHGMKMIADTLATDVDYSTADLLYIPGGMPGASNIAACPAAVQGIKRALAGGKRVAAICAAPAVVLGANGLLSGVKAVCYPGFEGKMTGAKADSARVVTDGNITTAKGPGCAVELGLELAELLYGAAARAKLAAGMIVQS